MDRADRDMLMDEIKRLELEFSELTWEDLIEAERKLDLQDAMIEAEWQMARDGRW